MQRRVLFFVYEGMQWSHCKAEGSSAPWACAPKIEIIEPSGATCAQNGARDRKGRNVWPERFAYRVGDKSHGPFFPIRAALGDMLDRKPCRYLARFVTFARHFPSFFLGISVVLHASASAMREEFFNYSRVIPSQSIFQHCVNTA